MLQKRSRWVLYGVAVFAASVLVWLSNPEWSNLISAVLLVVAVAAALLARSPVGADSSASGHVRPARPAIGSVHWRS